VIAETVLAVAQWLIRLVGFSVDQKTEQLRIKAGVDIAAIQSTIYAHKYARDVILSAHRQRVFWIVWSMFAVPLAAWWMLAMLDTMANGALPDVAAIPPTLRPYADAIVNNVFLTGGGMAIASQIVRALRG